ncbi:microfibril-associated protein [Diplodia corticola]|uniref:Microfibril-associated protein n=1 Tax=Diplodia corticola TaxID=236234 RepID=A0A1J9S0J1_9PEZI|nr:microfibril-associated protein [Diplodia corticola]OJD33189.1 microfibril-associated protein [Diplodia corticola]
MPPKRMTANPTRPARYRPGKPTAAEEPSSSEEDESDADEGQEEEQQRQQQPTNSTAAAPKASSFPKDASAKIASNLKNVDLNARRQAAAAAEAARLEAEKAARAAAEEGFETEEEEESGGGSGEGSESDESGSSEEEEEDSSSNEDEAAARRKKMLRPVFVRKDQRKGTSAGAAAAQKTEDEVFAEEEAKRKARADALVQEQLERVAAERAAGKKQWDDEDNLGDLDDVDDADGVDPEAEFAAWRLRELRRVKREREAIEEAEKEREEVERRRGLTQEERDAEDREFIERQREERAGKGTMSTMQKYFHKGAFFQDDLKDAGLDRRDIMGSRYVDDVQNKEALPEYMQIRDMTKLGKKGRTRYKDMRSEDTGRWGDFGDRRGKGGGAYYKGVDERFRPDGGEVEGRAGATGANASAVGERKRHGDDREDRDGKRPRVAD